ncbi:uncharacterized protein [Onthophagus taurus]|uniref:uncharacterized protein n=1 Tax=Onthophagus taurus TaxID=166361 RepID=UPI000C2020FD|nr:uncharacterized protein LOC111417271 [Onthophagus taurus]
MENNRNSSNVSLKSSSPSVSESRCSRTIRSSKYEHNDPSQRLWWTNTFKRLEDEVSIMPYEREDVIDEMFPEISPRLKNILTFQKVSKDLPCYSIKGPKRKIRRKTSTILDTARYGSKESLMTDYNEYPENTRINSAPANNPYRKFFKTKIERARIWREIPPLRLDEMNLIQKADAITESIARNFHNWLKSLSEEGTSSLDKETIMSMFQIGFNYHAANSVYIKVKEMPAVTDTIAISRDLPEASVRANLHKHLTRDLKAYNTKEKQCAFGTMLPLELRSMPPKDDFADKWFGCKRVPPELASMEAVWGGIEHLRSTRAFCTWLLNHPDIPPPEYLEAKGMLNRKFLSKPLSNEDLMDADSGKDL